LSMPIHDEVVRAGIRANELGIHLEQAKGEFNEMMKKGIIVDTGRRFSSGYYADFPIVRVIF